MKPLSEKAYYLHICMSNILESQFYFLILLFETMNLETRCGSPQGQSCVWAMQTQTMCRSHNKQAAELGNNSL